MAEPGAIQVPVVVTPVVPDPPKSLPLFVTIFEKIASTYVISLLSMLLINWKGDLDLSAIEQLGIAAIPAAFTAAMNLLPSVPSGLPFYTDLVLRVGRTFVANFLGFLVALPHFDLSYATWRTAFLASIPSVITVAKGMIAGHFVGGETPALLPQSLDTSSSATPTPAVVEVEAA
jgi:hypothetical protein